MAVGILPVSRDIEDVIEDGYEVKLLRYLHGGWFIFKSHPAAFLFVAFLFTFINETLSYFIPPSAFFWVIAGRIASYASD